MQQLIKTNYKFYSSIFVLVLVSIAVKPSFIVRAAGNQLSIISSGSSAKLVVNGAYSGNSAAVNMGSTIFGNQIIPVMESPPWVVDHNTSNGWSSYLLTSADTFACNSADNLALSTTVDCTGSAVPDHFQTQNDMEKSTADTIPSSPPYKRNYYGAFAGQTITSGSNFYRVSVNHGENKNDIEYNHGSISQPGTGNNYQSTIKSLNAGWDPVAGTGCSEYDAGGGTCQNTTIPWFSNASYSGFISSSIVQDTANNNWGNGSLLTDQGPIVWPELGYGTGTTGAAYPTTPNSFQYMGVRHPYSLVVGNFMYVYYLDTSGSDTTTGDGSGADTGIKVARSQLSSLGAMGSWENYDAANGLWDLPSIPPGMNASNINSYLNTPGPQQAPLWSSNPEAGGYVPVSFQVASIANDPGLYLGVESEYSNSTNAWRAELRTSTNLVTWSDPVPVTATSGAGNVNGQTNGEQFSILLSGDGASNSVLDGFNSTNNQLTVDVESSIGSVPYLQQLTLQLPAVAAPIVGDLNNDGHVNAFDLSIFLNHWLQSGVGLPEDFDNNGVVNAFDLNALLSHWGV